MLGWTGAFEGEPVRLGKQFFSGRDLTNPRACWRFVLLWWDVQPAGRCPISAEVIKQFKYSVCCGVSRESKFWSFLTVPHLLPRATLRR